ncbi:DUF4190 domain-containing protein [Tumebacillus sp. ITR2]|uniref:DUF4190 domain-containing protein n=1 Tax=Tumebacillus amylolyticus TaxID=2801339 RepID=A0ABS1J520_9BACL|nr:DUF4190 domain-containing protein [Tumebacillus amylolyticus]MBL0385290.1 DUF4190 domain-containing protein [Tumebacillus amylolyticus]
MNTPIEPQAQHNPTTNGKAIASMILGIVSLVIPYVGLITGIIAMVLSSSSKKDIARTGQQGHGMATAGFVTGLIAVILYAIVILLFIILGVTLASLDGSGY